MFPVNVFDHPSHRPFSCHQGAPPCRPFLSCVRLAGLHVDGNFYQNIFDKSWDWEVAHFSSPNEDTDFSAPKKAGWSQLKHEDLQWLNLTWVGSSGQIDSQIDHRKVDGDHLNMPRMDPKTAILISDQKRPRFEISNLYLFQYVWSWISQINFGTIWNLNFVPVSLRYPWNSSRPLLHSTTTQHGLWRSPEARMAPLPWLGLGRTSPRTFP